MCNHVKTVGIRVFGCLLSALILQGVGTVSRLYAEYPSWSSLLKHWYLEGGRTIPDAYRRLSDRQKAFEENERNGMLSEEDKKNRLRFFWEIKANGEVFERPPENVNVRIDGSLRCFFLTDVFVQGKECAWEEEACSRMGSPKLVLPYIRFMNIVASKQFLIDVLTRDFVTELDGKFGGRESDSEVVVRYIFNPIYSKSDDGRRRYLVQAGVSVPQRVSVMIEIRQSGGNSDFSVSLRLTWNTSTDEIEKVELVDRVIVNEPVFDGKDGTVLFEKK